MGTIDTAVVAAFIPLWLVIVPTPGANSLMITHLALTRPPAHVAFALLGNVGGILMLAASALLGWGALLEAFPWLRLAVYGCGGAYLIYFGWRLLQRARSAPVGGALTEAGERLDRTEPLKAIGRGLVTALSNAQAILFITSIFAFTGVLTASAATGLAVLGIIATLNCLYLGFLGWMFQRETIRRGYMRFRRWFEGSIGVLFIGFGGRLIWREVMR